MRRNLATDHNSAKLNQDLSPPRTWSGEDFLRALSAPWYRLVADLEDLIWRRTSEFGHAHGLRGMFSSLTTRTVTCPNTVGSDSRPVPVTVNGVDTYLTDSSQFMLEYGCRLAPSGCYSLLPSFRGDAPDEVHLGQFLHSEAEIPGGLDDLIDYAEAYLRHLAKAILGELGDRVAAVAGDIAHLSRMADRCAGFERITFDEAARLLGNFDGDIRQENEWRTLTRQGERRLMTIIDEFVWVTHFDHLSVPFYQAFGDENGRTASNADLLLGMGEVIGSGERHATGDQLRSALTLHGVAECDYAWYLRMKDSLPLRTAGFGMGVERFLMWVLAHDDIRDIPLISRIGESFGWPKEVDRP